MMTDHSPTGFAKRAAAAGAIIESLDRDLSLNVQINSGWESIQLPDIEKLEKSVDHLRHTLWACVIGLEQHAERHAANALRDYRMDRIRQMLRELRSESAHDPTIQLFLAEVKRMAES